MILSVNGVTKQFGIEYVLDGVSFRIDAREKVALVGRNGTGKTTLLKMITGRMDPDKGSIQVARGASIGYLKQEAPVTQGRTVLEEAQSGLAHLLELKQRLTELEATLEHNPTPEDLDEYSLLSQHFNDQDGYSAERDVQTVLLRMGFTEDEFSKPTESLSGGEKTRLAIARILLEEPELLILDEPTNHLDLQATEWLEGWIKNYHGAVLLVSHDRAFLEATAQRVLELKGHSVRNYPAGYAKFLQLRAEYEAEQAMLAAKQEAQIAKMDEYVRRFINTQRTAQARGRRKQMERLMETKIDAPKHDRGMAAGFQQTKRSGDLVLETKKLDVGFSDETLIHGLDWIVQYQDRWGVIGENGAGKSTLIKTVLGKHPAVGGHSRVGSNVELGYFTQDATQLDLDSTPLDYLVWEYGMDAGPARDLLGRFLFEGDDVFRPIRTLSGGEKNKLVLAGLTYANPNLLVLDEPTNHLDMDSREALANVLNDYKGTLILISHDRWLLGQVTTSILDVRRSGAILFPGGYQEYRERGSRVGASETGKSKSPVKSATPVEPTLTPRELSKEIARMRKVVETCEETVFTREEAIASLEAMLASPPAGADIHALSINYQEAKSALEAAMSDWEAQSVRLEQLVVQQNG